MKKRIDCTVLMDDKRKNTETGKPEPAVYVAFTNVQFEGVGDDEAKELASEFAKGMSEALIKLMGVKKDAQDQDQIDADFEKEEDIPEGVVEDQDEVKTSKENKDSNEEVDPQVLTFSNYNGLTPLEALREHGKEALEHLEDFAQRIESNLDEHPEYKGILETMKNAFSTYKVGIIQERMGELLNMDNKKHVNWLNKKCKEITGKTYSQLIEDQGCIELKEVYSSVKPIIDERRNKTK